MSASMACAGSTPNVWSTHSIRSPTPNAPRRAAFAPSSGATTAVSRLGAAIPPRRARRPCRRGSIASSAAGPASPPSTVCSRACAPTRANCSRCSNGPISRSTPTAPRTTFVARSPSARSAAEPAATPAATAATPSSASTRPAPSSASPSGTTSAHASPSQAARTSPNLPKSSARAPRGHPNRRDFCPCYSRNVDCFVASLLAMTISAQCRTLQRRDAANRAEPDRTEIKEGSPVRTIKGPALLIAQLASDRAPFNSLPGIAKWAASLGYVGLQLPSSDTRFLDLHRCAESQTYADEIAGVLKEYGLAVTELVTALQGQLVAVHPAYDAFYDAFAPTSLRGNPKACQAWAVEEMKIAAKASQRLGLKLVQTFSGSLAW